MNSEQTRDILKKVRQIEIRTNRLVTDTLAGQYHSVFKGRGMNFDDVREYVPGDEVRTIDWNVTARAGRPFVKKFVEERELTLLLMVDVSASGDFGSGAQSKRELAAEIASVLAFSAIKNSDKVGLLLFTDQVELFMPPRKGRRHVLRIVREVLGFEPARRGTDLVQALDFVNDVIKRRAIVFLLSDFQTAGTSTEDLRRALRQTNRRHDLVALPIEDARERLLPDLGVVAIEDAETGELIELDTRNPAVRRRFTEIAERPRRPAPARLQRRGRRFAPPRHRSALRRRPHGLLQKPHPQTLMKNLRHLLSLSPEKAAAVVAFSFVGLTALAAAAAGPGGRRRSAPAPTRRQRLPTAPEEDILDIRGPIHIPAAFPWAAWTAGSLAAAGLGFGAWALLRRPRRKLPYEIALENLEQTAPAHAVRKTHSAFSLAVSEIVRRLHRGMSAGARRASHHERIPARPAESAGQRRCRNIATRSRIS